MEQTRTIRTIVNANTWKDIASVLPHVPEWALPDLCRAVLNQNRRTWRDIGYSYIVLDENGHWIADEWGIAPTIH